MPAKPQQEGYLLIDHRNCAGISEELTRAAGVNMPIVGAGQTYEARIKQCAHCGIPFILHPDRRGYCRSCDKYVCDNPKCNAECMPFTKLLDVMQEQAFREEFGYLPLANPFLR